MSSSFFLQLQIIFSSFEIFIILIELHTLFENFSSICFSRSSDEANSELFWSKMFWNCLAYLIKYRCKGAVASVVGTIIAKIRIIHKFVKVVLNTHFRILPQNLIHFDEILLELSLDSGSDSTAAAQQKVNMLGIKRNKIFFVHCWMSLGCCFIRIQNDFVLKPFASSSWKTNAALGERTFFFSKIGV